jgi:hypothetical protein
VVKHAFIWQRVISPHNDNFFRDQISFDILIRAYSL